MTISVVINGESQTTACGTLQELIDQLELKEKRFAVELNTCIVPKSLLAETVIHSNDTIEIIQAVGGG